MKLTRHLRNNDEADGVTFVPHFTFFSLTKNEILDEKKTKNAREKKYQKVKRVQKKTKIKNKHQSMSISLRI